MAVKTTPKNAPPAYWAEATGRLLAEGRFAGALEMVLAGCALYPQDLTLLPLAVRCHIFIGEHHRARELLPQLEKAALERPSVLGQCAELYAQCRMPGEALRLYRALAASGSRDARYNLGANLLALGQLDEAENTLESLIADFPTDCQAHQVLSGIRRATPECNRIERLEKMLSRSGLPVMDRVQLRYALGKELEDIGAFAQAFSHFRSGAELRRRGMNYRVAADVQILAEIERHHGSPLKGRNPDPACGNEVVFVMGLPRSGTTLVDRILSSHSRCDSFGEITDLPLSLMVAAGRSLPKEQLVQETAQWPAEWISNGYLERLGNFGSSAEKHIDKTPLNFLYAGLIARALPGATVIWMERHPLDACFAMYKTLFRMGYPFSYSLEDLADYYIAYWRLKSRWRDTLGDRVHFQSYEALVEDFSSQSRALVARAGLKWEDCCGKFHKNRGAVSTASSAQVRRPLYKSAVGHWKHYREQLQPLAEKLESAGISL